MKIRHNGVDKEIAHVRDLPLLSLGTRHLFELPAPLRTVFRVFVVFDGYEVERAVFKPEPNPDIEKTSISCGTLATREALWSLLTGGGAL